MKIKNLLELAGVGITALLGFKAYSSFIEGVASRELKDYLDPDEVEILSGYYNFGDNEVDLKSIVNDEFFEFMLSHCCMTRREFLRYGDGKKETIIKTVYDDMLRYQIAEKTMWKKDESRFMQDLRFITECLKHGLEPYPDGRNPYECYELDKYL